MFYYSKQVKRLNIRILMNILKIYINLLYSLL